ncbi:hypothetical protein ACFWBX_09155 [Streptomyces sp. NPDC059991]|uniref:hypothetical protein n=1 Tax=Streptomyces sp. NPDC059991 TaxID=3347028 RepID=UPI0036BED4B4
MTSVIRAVLAAFFIVAALAVPQAAPRAYATDVPLPDLCDLPGCRILKKGLEKGFGLSYDANKPLIDTAGKAVEAGKTAYDLASDPMGYFSEKFAQTSGKLIQELGGELGR